MVESIQPCHCNLEIPLFALIASDSFPNLINCRTLSCHIGGRGEMKESSALSGCGLFPQLTANPSITKSYVSNLTPPEKPLQEG